LLSTFPLQAYIKVFPPKSKFTAKTISRQKNLSRQTGLPTVLAGNHFGEKTFWRKNASYEHFGGKWNTSIRDSHYGCFGVRGFWREMALAGNVRDPHL